jgi:hypothetical protein
MKLTKIVAPICLTALICTYAFYPAYGQWEKCRPRTNNWLQRITQKLAHPNTPLCRVKPKITPNVKVITV